MNRCDEEFFGCFLKSEWEDKVLKGGGQLFQRVEPVNITLSATVKLSEKKVNLGINKHLKVYGC